MLKDNFDDSPQNAEASPRSASGGEIVLGTLIGLDSAGRPLVEYSGNPAGHAVAAISTVAITQAEAGRAVALLFADGDSRKPVIMGLIQNSLYTVLETTLAQSGQAGERSEENGESQQGFNTDPNASNMSGSDVKVDGERVVIEGEKEIVLKCGESSITLTRAGKIIIRGKYLLNRSSGVNRIMGGSVQVN